MASYSLALYRIDYLFPMGVLGTFVENQWVVNACTHFGALYTLVVLGFCFYASAILMRGMNVQNTSYLRVRQLNKDTFKQAVLKRRQKW